MMKIQKLSLSNFKCFRKVILPDKKNEEIPSGLIIIQGNTKEKSNSFGKTSLVEAILVAFFGPAASNLSINDMITFGENNSEIRLHFSLDSKEYLIIRKLKRGKHQGTQSVKYFQKVGSDFREDPSIKIEELLQITWSQAKGTVFVKQGEIESLVQAKPSELRDLIIKLFRLDITQSAQDYLHEIKKNNELELKKLQKKFRNPKEIEGEIKEQKKELDSENEHFEEVENELKLLKQKIEKYPKIDLIDELDRLNNSIMSHNSKISVYEKEINNFLDKNRIDETKITTLIKELIAKNKDLDIKIQEINKKRDDLKKKQTEIETQIRIIEKNMNKVKNSIKFESGTELAKCPTCQRDISTEEKNNILKHFQSEITELKKKIPKIDLTKFNVKPLQSEITDNKLKISNLEGIQKKIKTKNKLEDAIKDIRTEVEKKLIHFKVKNFKELLSKFNIKNLMDLKSQIVTINEKIKSKNKNVSEIKIRIEKITNKIENLSKKLKEMETIAKKMEDLEKRSLHAEYCKKLIKSFVTEYMVEKRLIKNINSVTSNLIEYFTGRQYDSISLTSGGSQGTSLFISVHDTYSNIQKEKKFLSGGDKAAIGFALRFGISELMQKIRPTRDSPRRNPKIDFLILDEPFGTLDTSRREEILKTLQSQKKFNQIFLITHTTIPEDVNAHFIKITKNVNTGLSSSELFINQK